VELYLNSYSGFLVSSYLLSCIYMMVIQVLVRFIRLCRMVIQVLRFVQLDECLSCFCQVLRFVQLDECLSCFCQVIQVLRSECNN
jgi:hypothetical protein